jgi:hypothetical protein
MNSWAVDPDVDAGLRARPLRAEGRAERGHGPELCPRRSVEPDRLAQTWAQDYELARCELKDGLAVLIGRSYARSDLTDAAGATVRDHAKDP